MMPDEGHGIQFKGKWYIWLTFHQREIVFVTFCLLFVHLAFFDFGLLHKKGILSEANSLLPNPFDKGDKIFGRVVSLASVSIPINSENAVN